MHIFVLFILLLIQLFVIKIFVEKSSLIDILFKSTLLIWCCESLGKTFFNFSLPIIINIVCLVCESGDNLSYSIRSYQELIGVKQVNTL